MSELNTNFQTVEQITGNIFPKGEKGNGIDRIERTNRVGLVDTYSIYFTDGTTTTFTVTNGEKGDTGEKGEQGIQGIQGPQGIQGIQGVPGEAFSIYKTYESIAAMNADKNNVEEGKFVLIASTVEQEDNAKLYVKGSTDFVFLIDMSGATGIQGPQGIQGIQGIQGETGPKGDPGDVSTEQLNEAITNATKTQKQTEIAEEQTITDCAGVNGKIEIVSGKTEQDSYEGKNLLGLVDGTYTLNGITAVVEDGIVTLNGTPSEATWLTLPIKENINLSNNYTLSINNAQTIGDNTDWASLRLNNNISQTVEAKFNTVNKTNTFNLTMIVDKVVIRTAANLNFSNFVLKPQLEEGLTATNFEPYVGGQPSPNPSYPQEIKSVGSNINLLKSTGLTEATSFGVTFTPVYENGLLQYINVNGTNNSSNSASTYVISQFTAKNREKYTISGVKGYTADTLQIFSASSNAFAVGNRLQCFDGPVTRTATADETFDVRIQVGIGVALNNIKVYPMIKQGDIATGYSPYNCGSINYKVENKNLFSETFQQGNLDFGGTGEEVAKTTRIRTDYIEVKPNTIYTISSANSNLESFGVGLYKSDNSYDSSHKINNGNWNSFPYSFTTQNDTKYIRIAFRKNDNSDITPTGDYKIQLEQGSIDTSYIAHSEQNITVPLLTGMELCKIGEYSDKIFHNISSNPMYNASLVEGGWYKYNEIGKLVLDGTEEWTAQGSTSTGLYRFGITSSCPSSTVANVIATHFKSIALNDRNSVDYSSIFSNGTYILPQVTSDIATTINGFKTFLSQNNVTLYYQLATPTYTQITDTTTLEALYEIEHLQMYEGYTHIECIDEIKPDIKVTYLYNNEVNNYYGSIIDALEERLHVLEQS